MPSSRRTLVLRLGVGLVAAALLLGHLLFWYWPRERAATFGDSALSRDFAAGPSLAAALWIPFPHQNLAALTDAAGDRQEFLAALFRTVGSSAPGMPRFGPLALPPSREMIVAVDPGGDRLLVSCRVYPTIAVFARLAGIVAGNPWLRGGSVELSGAPAEVTWDRFRWTVATSGVELAAAFGAPDAVTEVGADDGAGDRRPVRALAVLRAEQPPEPLPAGLYTLSRRDGGLEIRLGESDVPSAQAERWSDRPPAGMLLLAPDDRVPRAARALGLFPASEDAAFGLPDLVTLTRGPIEPWEVAALSLLRGLGVGGRSRQVGAWEVVAMSEQGLEAAIAALPPLEGVLTGPQGARLTLGGAVDLEAQRTLLDGLIEVATRIPLVPASYRTTLEDARTLTAPLGGFDLATLTVLEEPSEFVLRLHPAASSH